MGSPVEVGRYLLHDAIASGGMARVHVGRIVGPAGFSRTVAIKRLHPHLAGDPKFATMFLDEARLASRIHHPNVIGTLDVVAQGDELFLVMDFVRGESLSQLLQRAEERGPRPSVPVIVAVAVGALYGLHAAHEARDEAQRPLDIVHRDVSPQNVLVGIDGIARVVDFGIAKAASRLQQTENGELKGKLAYMAPEQLLNEPVDRRTDVYSAAVTLWEALACRRLFVAESAGALVSRVIDNEVPPPSASNPEVPPELDAVVLRGLAGKVEARFETALAMAEALARVVTPASPREVGAWVEEAGGDELRARVQRLVALEQGRVPTDPVSIAGVLSGTERRRIIEAPTGPIAPAQDPSAALATAAMPASTAVVPVATVALHRGRLASETTTSSNATLSPMTAPEPPSRASRRLAVALALLAAAGGTALAATRFRATAPAAAPSAGAASPGASAPSASPTASAASAPAPTPPPTGAPPSPNASAPSAPSANRARTSAPRRSPGPRPTTAQPSPPAAATGAAPGCDPPYTIDESGIKRFKRWCAGPP